MIASYPGGTENPDKQGLLNGLAENESAKLIAHASTVYSVVARVGDEVRRALTAK